VFKFEIYFHNCADGKQKVPAVSSSHDRDASEEVSAQQNGHPKCLPGLYGYIHVFWLHRLDIKTVLI